MKTRTAMFTVLASTLALTGCVTQNVMNRMGEETFGPLIGQPVSAAVAIYGAPEEERVVLGQRVVIWRRGDINTFNCTIKLTIDDADIITAYDVGGTDCVGNEVGKKTFGKRSGVVAEQGGSK